MFLFAQVLNDQTLKEVKQVFQGLACAHGVSIRSQLRRVPVSETDARGVRSTQGGFC